MRVVRTVAELRDALRELRAGALVAPDGTSTVGFVPTMGALHEGHLSLLRAARAENDLVVLSIFVNPTQFGEADDLASYPRAEAEDLALAAEAGVGIVFAPDAEEVYPRGFATTVSVTGSIADTLEGAVRGRSHFDGVATVVAKLLLAVLPDAAYFGAKDAQQSVVVRRMVADLGIPTRIVVCPTSREADGLARSSRNVRLSPEERQRARAIPRALRGIHSAVYDGETEASALRAHGLRVLSEEDLAVEYLELVDPETFEPLDRVGGAALVVVAARVGETRLLDNTLLDGAAPGNTLPAGLQFPAR